MSTTNPFHLPLITQQNLVTQPGYLGNPPGQEEGYGFHRNMPDQTGDIKNDYKNQLKQSQTDSFDSERSINSLEDNNQVSNTHRLSRDSEDSGYTPRHQKKSSRETKEKNTNLKIEEAEINVNRASPVEYKTVKIIEPQVIHSVPYQGPDGRLIAPPTPIPSGRVIASPLPGPRKNKGENTAKEGKKKSKKGKLKQRSRSSSLEKQKTEYTDNVGKLAVDPVLNDVIPTIEDVEDRSKYAQFPSPAKSTRPSLPYANENELDSGIADDYLGSSQEL